MEMSTNPTSMLNSYINPKYGQYVNYCSWVSTTTGFPLDTATPFISLGIDTASLESEWSSIGQAASSMA